MQKDEHGNDIVSLIAVALWPNSSMGVNGTARLQILGFYIKLFPDPSGLVRLSLTPLAGFSVFSKIFQQKTSCTLTLL